MTRFSRSTFTAISLACIVGALALIARSAPSARLDSNDAEKARAEKIVGPEINSMNCASCHALEDETWQRTHHFSTFVRRHRTERAQRILKNMGLLTMKRQDECRRCHYTSVLKSDRLMPTWGVSCESCHGPGKDWVSIHNHVNGDPNAPMLKWGDGKKETKAQRDARLSAAEAKGMITSRMIYDLARQCLECHTVPDERLVNRGKHRAGSDFEMVAWSQGEVRHNFVDSRGAPDRPSNRVLSPNERRRMYVVGVLADLEVSLRNLSEVKQHGGDYEDAMVERVNAARTNAQRIVAAAHVPEIEAVLKRLPKQIEASTAIPTGAPEEIADAGRKFAARYDGTTLAAIDPQIPREGVGTPYTR